MTLTGASLAAAALAAAVAGAGGVLVAATGPVDAPRARGSHTNPTVTSGGLTVLVGASLGLVLYAYLAPSDAVNGLDRCVMALGFAGMLGLVGALDDLIEVGPKAKLAIQTIASIAFAALANPIQALPLAPGLIVPLGWIGGMVGTTLWLVVATNAVNFMDGANGLASGSMVIVFAALSAAGFVGGDPAVGAISLIAAAAIAGFLPWNWPAGKLFQGDVGAVFTGFLAASLAVVAARSDGLAPGSVYIVPFALTPFLTDVLLTLLVRAREGKPLLQAHREHLYQLWLDKTGKSHGALAWRAAAWTGIYGAVGLLAQSQPTGVRPLVFGAGVAISVIGWFALRKKLTRPG